MVWGGFTHLSGQSHRPLLSRQRCRTNCGALCSWSWERIHLQDDKAQAHRASGVGTSPDTWNSDIAMADHVSGPCTYWTCIGYTRQARSPAPVNLHELIIYLRKSGAIYPKRTSGGLFAVWGGVASRVSLQTEEQHVIKPVTSFVTFRSSPHDFSWWTQDHVSPRKTLLWMKLSNEHFFYIHII